MHFCLIIMHSFIPNNSNKLKLTILQSLGHKEGLVYDTLF